MNKTKSSKHDFYVDEAGDLTLFNKRGRIIVGEEGSSKYFMLGTAAINDCSPFDNKFLKLRTELLSDPYFKDVPSIHTPGKKTAVQFHAKDDLPEVRREVFKILVENPVKVQVVLRRKNEIAHIAKTTYKLMHKKLTENNIYDDLVKRLFRNLLHKAETNNIYFSMRGKKNRNEALKNAIEKSKRNFELKYNIPSDKPVEIFSAFPKEHSGLQVIDYYLWALQRLYEKGEDRFFNLIKKNYRLIIDLDDKRNHEYGEYFSDQNPLSLKKIMLDKS